MNMQKILAAIGIGILVIMMKKIAVAVENREFLDQFSAKNRPSGFVHQY